MEEGGAGHKGVLPGRGRFQARLVTRFGKGIIFARRAQAGLAQALVAQRFVGAGFHRGAQVIVKGLVVYARESVVHVAHEPIRPARDARAGHAEPLAQARTQCEFQTPQRFFAQPFLQRAFRGVGGKQQQRLRDFRRLQRLLRKVGSVVPAAQIKLVLAFEGGHNVRVAHAVPPGHGIAAALAEEEVEGFPRAIAPGVGAHAHAQRLRAFGDQFIISLRAQGRKIQHRECANGRVLYADGRGIHGFVFAAQLELALQSRADGDFFVLWRVAGKAGAQLARVGLPAARVFAALHALDGNIRDFIARVFAAGGVAPGDQVEEGDARHFIAGQIGDFPQDARPFAVFQVHLVGTLAVELVRQGNFALVVKLNVQVRRAVPVALRAQGDAQAVVGAQVFAGQIVANAGYPIVRVMGIARFRRKLRQHRGRSERDVARGADGQFARAQLAPAFQRVCGRDGAAFQGNFLRQRFFQPSLFRQGQGLMDVERIAQVGVQVPIHGNPSLTVVFCVLRGFQQAELGRAVCGDGFGVVRVAARHGLCQRARLARRQRLQQAQIF